MERVFGLVYKDINRRVHLSLKACQKADAAIIMNRVNRLARQYEEQVHPTIRNFLEDNQKPFKDDAFTRITMGVDHDDQSILHEIRRKKVSENLEFFELISYMKFRYGPWIEIEKRSFTDFSEAYREFINKTELSSVMIGNLQRSESTEGVRLSIFHE